MGSSKKTKATKTNSKTFSVPAFDSKNGKAKFPQVIWQSDDLRLIVVYTWSTYEYYLEEKKTDILGKPSWQIVENITPRVLAEVLGLPLHHDYNGDPD